MTLLGVACVAHPPERPTGWTSDRLRLHPLVGKIWDTRLRRFVSPEYVAERAAAATFVLLGEKHDNPDHHRLQAWVLASIVHSGRRPTVALEMLEADTEPALQEYLRGSRGDAEGLGVAVGWEERGWPPWEIYRPIADVAVEHGLSIVAADLSSDQVRRISREGLAAVPEGLRDLAALDQPLSPALEADFAEEIRDAHCGMVPDSSIGPMIAVQRARDAAMASRLLETGEPDGAVLIAGAGHVRRNRGAPLYLDSVPPERILSVAFLEVERGVGFPDRAAGGGPEVFDLAWFTPRVDEIDPCEKFREQLERLRDHGPGH